MAARQRAVATLPTLMRALKYRDSAKIPNTPLPSLRRAFSLYDQINLIDNVPDDQLRFQGYTDTGFTVNGNKYEGSVLCVGNLLLSWTPKKFSEITAESLSIFQTVRPVPEILILGCGRYIQQVNPELRQFIRSTGMKLEAVDSDVEILTFIYDSSFGDDWFFPIHRKTTQTAMNDPDLTEVKLPSFISQKNAASTYNILNEEGRIVAAAILPYGVTC